MKAMVVFESMFGNTEAVAHALAEGISSRMEVDVVEVGAAPTTVGDDVALLVVGGPTHAFGLTRPDTRRSAAEQAAGTLVSHGIGLREWLGTVSPAPGAQTAAFDTRVDKPRVPGSAARGVRRRLGRRGFRGPTSVKSFFVAGSRGPLLPAEPERARRWGEELASDVLSHQSPRAEGPA